MPTGIKPRVNEAREFLEIAKDFKDPREIIREALSNSWDATATRASISFDLVPVPGSRKKKTRVTITDDGEGMSSVDRPSVGSSEIEGFFNLGDSAKGKGSIGTKGHGTKIYYKSGGIKVETWKSGTKIIAFTETDPWAALKQGFVPTFGYDETADPNGRGTKIVVDGFEAKQSEFSSLDDLIAYIGWYTVVGSFGHYFGNQRSMAVSLKPANGGTHVSMPFGFRFPDEVTDFTGGTEAVCKIFGPETISAGTTSEGLEVRVEIVGALLGEDNRGFVPHTYDNMGLWLAKDYIRIERENALLERASGGQYYYRNFLILANCQQFDLTANRNNIRSSGEEYDLAAEAVEEWCRKVLTDTFTKAYFDRKREEDAAAKRERDERARKDREQKSLSMRDQRINQYKGRPDLPVGNIAGAPRKEPQNEAETALLLQAMISSMHPGIDFVIGDYSTSRGVDLLVERQDKGFTSYWWVELVSKLENLFAWSHHPDGYHAIVCYELGSVAEEQKFTDGRTAKLTKKGAGGRYSLVSDTDTFEVYVLRELLWAHSNKSSGE